MHKAVTSPHLMDWIFGWADSPGPWVSTATVPPSPGRSAGYYTRSSSTPQPATPPRAAEQSRSDSGPPLSAGGAVAASASDSEQSPALASSKQQGTRGNSLFESP
jgi:hypothetical protein